MSRQVTLEASNSDLSIQAFAADKEACQQLSSQLAKLGYQPNVGKGSLAEATRWCQQHQADVLLVDIDAEATPEKSVAQLLTFCEPSCRIIVIGSAHDINLYRALLGMGIVDYLTKPLLLDLLSKALVSAQQSSHQPVNRAGRTVAVTAVAGGLGVSTVVAALAQVLADERRIPVAVVDFDRQKSDQPVLLASQNSGNLNAVLHTPQIDVRLLERSMEAISERLHLVFQTPDIATPVMPANVDHLFEFGSHLCQLANLVLWDLPASLPEGAAEVLQHAQVRIILTEYSVAAARHTRALLQHIGDESDGQQLLLVASQGHGTKGSIDSQAFAQYVGRAVDLVLPELDYSAKTSLLQGALTLPRGHFKQQLQVLADQITGQSQSAARSPLKRLAQQFARRHSA